MPQFTTRTILLLTAFVAITTAGLIGLSGYAARNFPGTASLWPVAFALYGAPIWIPIAFAAHAIGRRRITVSAVAALAVAEAIPLAVIYFW